MLTGEGVSAGEVESRSPLGLPTWVESHPNWRSPRFRHSSSASGKVSWCAGAIAINRVSIRHGEDGLGWRIGVTGRPASPFLPIASKAPRTTDSLRPVRLVGAGGAGGALPFSLGPQEPWCRAKSKKLFRTLEGFPNGLAASAEGFWMSEQ
jgi:hypothetical protein